MLKMTAKRITLSVLAVLLVLIAYTLVARIPVAHWWHALSTPSANSIAQQLGDPDPAVRRQALGQVDYINRHDAGVIAALADVAQDGAYPLMQVMAINNLAAEQGDYLSNLQDTPRLPQQTIDAVAALVMQELDANVFGALCNFLANTARWQTDAQRYLTRLTEKLMATQDKRSTIDILGALRGYAAFHVFPAATFDAVLRVYQVDDMQWGHAVRAASEIFYTAAPYQRFPDPVREAIEQALRDHPNRDIRRNAMFTLGNQSLHTGELSPALQDALDDADKEIRDKAGWQITRFNEKHGNPAGDGLAALLATARDTTLPASVRSKALAEALRAKPGAGPSPESGLAIAELFLQDAQPELRAGGVSELTNMSHHAAYQQRLPEIHDWLQLALNDEQASVRLVAVRQLAYIKLDDTRRHDYLVTALADPDREVVLEAMRVVGTKKLDSAEIEASLQTLAALQDPVQANPALAQLQRIEAQRKGRGEKIIETLKDKKSWGGLLFFANAALGIALAAGFAFYYAYRLLAFAVQKRWRALTSFGVLVAWAVATYGMVMLFVFAAFGMGHNAPAPLKDQLTIDGVLFVALLIYTGAGWLLHYLVREPRGASQQAG